jgi:hypothetical protein
MNGRGFGFTVTRMCHRWPTIELLGQSPDFVHRTVLKSQD